MKIEQMVCKIIDQYRKFRFVPATKNIIYHFLTRERTASYGNKNQERTFYVIRSIDDTSSFYIGPIHNLLANYFYVLSHIAYAEQRGWIPVVDQMNYPVYNSKRYPIRGTMNAWEYFWEQPYGYSLEEVYGSKNVVLSKQNWVREYDLGYDAGKHEDSDLLDKLRKIAQRVCLCDEIKSEIDKRNQNVFENVHDKVLGVSFRFEGYSKGAAGFGKGHPRQPKIDEMIDLTKEYLQKWKMSYVFLCTDVSEAIVAYQKVFRNKLIYIPRRRFSVPMTVEDRLKFFDENDVNKIALDYLTEITALSMCDGLLGSISSGFRYAIVNGIRYEYIKVIDAGLLPDDRRYDG